jgi:hypothetical protein
MANDAMSGRNRLPSGGPRKASQKRMRPAAPKPIQIEIPWRPGDRVRWRDRAGVYRRDVEDGENAFIDIDGRVYRVRRAELRPG